jgi:hypothetical protein
MTTDSKVERGVLAEHLLANELLNEVLSGLDGEYHKAWRNAQTPEAREDLHRYVKVLERFVTDLKEIALTGQIEQKRLNELEGKKRTAWATLTGT